MSALGCAEMAMRDAGMRIKPGSGVAAAEEYYRSTAKPIPAFGSAKAPREARTSKKKSTRTRTKKA